MEEKIIFENVRTKTKKSFVIIIVLSILLFVVFALQLFVGSAYEYDQHIAKDDHYYECYNEKGKSLIAEYENNPSLNIDVMLKETEGVDAINCEYNNFDNVFDCFLHELFNSDLLFLFIVISSACILIILLSIYCIYLTKCIFSVTENNIYGKKGFKKFDIAFIDIVAITQKRKCIIINTKNNKLKLSPLKKSDEIYNHIKPFVPERTITQQSTSIVDDIKLF